MATTVDRTSAAGYADDAEWRPPGQRPSHNASSRVANDDLVTRNGWLSRNGKPPRVLIVDDDPAIQMLCSINLQIEGLLVLDPPALASLVAGAVVCADTRQQPSTPRRASTAAVFHRAA
jgi:hypothetical protein